MARSTRALVTRTGTPGTESSGGLREALGAALRRAVPGPVRRLEREVHARLEAAPLRRNSYGYDPYGLHPAAAARFYLTAALLYRYWFRVETHGIERVPSGRVLLVANHAGQFAYDGAMLATAMLLEAEPPRVVRGQGEYFFWRVPWLGQLATQMGTVVGTPENCAALLEQGECVLVFPEGARGANKPFRQRYRLQPFGQGFLRLALQAGAPIVPVGIIGPEEQQPGLANLEGLGHALGLPSLPITISMPWLGILGPPFALPVKYHLYFGEPLRFGGRADDEDEAVERQVARVRAAIAELLRRGLRARRRIFF